MNKLVLISIISFFLVAIIITVIIVSQKKDNAALDSIGEGLFNNQPNAGGIFSPQGLSAISNIFMASSTGGLSGLFAGGAGAGD